MGEKMDKNKIIIIALIVIILALLVGIFAIMPNMNKQDTTLTFTSNATIDEGDYVKIKLTDANGPELAGQTVNITVTDVDNTCDYHSVVTDGEGNGEIKLDKDHGEYDVTVSYGGNEDYASCNATHKLTIKEKVVEATVSQSSSQSSGSSTHTIMGEDGYYYIVDDNGNILQSLGPSSKFYPNDPNSVYYPDAEPADRYIDKSK